jgi:hypothetical protein
MKEVIIKYKGSRVLELLKSLARYLDFSISEKQKEGIVPESGGQKKNQSSRFCE